MPPPTMTNRSWPDEIAAFNSSSVGAGSEPEKPPMAMTGWPVSSWMSPASFEPPTATIQVASPWFATR